MMKLWGGTDTGIVRTQNQDGYFIAQYGDDLLCAVVCDGMGGARAGNVASELAVEVFAAAMEGLGEQVPDDPQMLLKRIAADANHAVHTQATFHSDYAGMGTTMVAALVVGSCAHVLNIGDSRAYHVKENSIVRVTRDHSYVEDLVERGEITPEEARYHPRKNLITRALGSMQNVRADLFERELGAGEYLLLCSDGLTNVLTDQEILDEIIHGGSPDSCCSRLIDLVLSRGAPDNVTAVLLERA